MHIKRAKQEILDSIEATCKRRGRGTILIPSFRQRPILLMGPPGIGKTQIMEQIARKCGIALVSYTITHHTRQSAVGLPLSEKGLLQDRTCSVTEYTMSEIIASVYEKMERDRVKGSEFFFWMRSTVYRRRWRRRCGSFYSARCSEIKRFRKDGSSWRQAIRRSTINLSGSLIS
ncbi:MAG: AAA family ATPase [Sellimonas intestinalis]